MDLGRGGGVRSIIFILVSHPGLMTMMANKQAEIEPQCHFYATRVPVGICPDRLKRSRPGNPERFLEGINLCQIRTNRTEGAPQTDERALVRTRPANMHLTDDGGLVGQLSIYETLRVPADPR